MLGTTVLIPTLVFRSILGESVGWFFLSLSMSSFVLVYISFWVGNGVASFRSITNLQRKWVYDVGFKKILQALHHRLCMCVCVCVCYIAEWFIASGAECAFCFSHQYSVADFTGFSVAGSDGKLLLFSVYHTFYCQCSFNYRHSWPTWGKQTPFPISLSQSISIHCKSAVALRKNAKLSEPQKSLINTQSNRIPVYTTSSNFSLLLVCAAEISSCNEGNARSLHSRLSTEHHTRI